MDMKKKEKSVGLMGKIQAAKEMRDLASGMMKGGLGEKLKGLKEVKVASNTPEGLKKGLEKAEELVDKTEEVGEMENESPMEEMMEEGSEDEYSDVLEKCDTPEKIDELIKKLEDKKAEMMKD